MIATIARTVVYVRRTSKPYTSYELYEGNFPSLMATNELVCLLLIVGSCRAPTMRHGGWGGPGAR